jgi:DNA polymerase III epsilon subunit-like protein
MEILVVDIETTGFSKSDAIVEIGISLVNTQTNEIKLF